MNRTRTATVLAALAALVAPVLSVVAFSSPAEAGSVKRHDVNIYKLEGFVELEGEWPDNEAHEHLYCHDGDYAIDGMWKVDSYETPNETEGVYGDERSVRATENWGDAARFNAPAPDNAKWHFWFVNDGTGRATIKTFIVCLTPETGERAGHTHDIYVDAQTTVQNFEMLPGRRSYTFTPECDEGEYAVAPGFQEIGSSGKARLVGSEPTANYRSWTWTFQVESQVAFHFSLSCLEQRVEDVTAPSDTKAHTHHLDLEWLYPHANTIGASKRAIVTESGAPKDFAAVGAFEIADATDIWYLGQDARGRKRDFVFWNTGGAGGDSVDTGILALFKRTSPQLKP